ncbi:DUF3343 domain-containing protein [Clostridium sp. SYSU_GA19001]|uniref:DUF3343 domain-containing protein n=1 Tax=Clostridium caldaquaticum TaxID=2940653 RepID=UPI002076F867|nr:DUF3343 domain-containing protein [Clostridium caldaquaticum]
METYENEFIIVFQSYNQAMLLYSELIKMGCKVQMVSTPCNLTKGCSQSITFSTIDIRKIIDALENNNMKVAGIYKIIKNNNYVNYIPIQRA